MDDSPRTVLKALRLSPRSDSDWSFDTPVHTRVSCEALIEYDGDGRCVAYRNETAGVGTRTPLKTLYPFSREELEARREARCAERRGPGLRLRVAWISEKDECKRSIVSKGEDIDSIIKRAQGLLAEFARECSLSALTELGSRLKNVVFEAHEVAATYAAEGAEGADAGVARLEAEFGAFAEAVQTARDSM